MKIKGILEVWCPGKDFLDFIVNTSVFPRYYLENNINNQPMKLIVFNYKIGSFKGMIGNSAKFNNKPI